MNRKVILIISLIVLLILMILAPYLAVGSYKSQTKQTLTKLREEYSQNLRAAKDSQNEPRDAQAAKLIKIWGPYQHAAKSPVSLVPIGPLVLWSEDYKNTEQLQKETQDYIKQGAAYYSALQQLTNFYTESQSAIKKYTPSGTQSIDSLKDNVSAHREVIDLRKKIVTSSLLTDANAQYIETFNKIIGLYEQKISAMATGAQTDEIDTGLKEAGYAMSLLAISDTPKGLEDWQEQALPRLDELIAKHEK